MMNVTPVEQDSVKKPTPTVQASNCSPLRLVYASSPSGIDSNLLILLHGLGDTEKPFAGLGGRLQRNLPQTATLSLGGGHAVPFMDGASWGFWDVWDGMGQDIANPDPSVFLSAFQQLVNHLVRPESEGGCGWPASAIHVFGYTHGATAAMEGIIAWTRGQQQSNKIFELEAGQDRSDTHYANEVGSIVSICGELLSHPTFSPPLSVPLLAFERQFDARAASKAVSSIRRAFKNVQQVNFPWQSAEASMPQNEQEWSAVMQFWARLLRNRTSWELDGNLYTVSNNSTHGAASQSTSKTPTGASQTAQPASLRQTGWSPTAEQKSGR